MECLIIGIPFIFYAKLLKLSVSGNPEEKNVLDLFFSKTETPEDFKNDLLQSVQPLKKINPDHSLYQYPFLAG